ncbi:MAG: RagB/SusD family nutrient uptake outer membrane protein [Prevotella sp.]|jgi:hypothetical protein
MKLKIKYFVIFLAITWMTTGCSDSFLDRPSLSEISADNFYQTSNDLKLATAALYAGAPWAGWLYSSYLPIGEVLSGNMMLGWNGDATQFNSFSVTGMNGGVIAAWKGMFMVVGHCNVTINSILERTPNTVPEKEVNEALGEARFIRAFAYYNLAMLWHDVPIIEDNSLLISKPLVNRNLCNDVFQFIVNDLKFAADNLPEVNDKGRVTTWSAQGMLAKAYLAWSGLNSNQEGVREQALLDSARVYAGNVCNNSGLELMDSYADQFMVPNNDNQESLFALQWVPNTSDWLQGNMLQIYSAGGVEISANGQAGWFSIGPSYDMYLQYSDQDSIRRKATFMLKGDYYPELNKAGGGFTFKGTSGLKKHIIGTNKDNNAPTMSLTSSAEHNSLLRLADIYLVYAESILGNNKSTTEPEALRYFNMVRTRAGVNPVTSLNEDIILKERRIELCAESHYWFDLVRLSFFSPQKAIDMLNNQKRVTFTIDESGSIKPDDPSNTMTAATINTFTLPIPSEDLTANPKLLDEPVPYFK